MLANIFAIFNNNIPITYFIRTRGDMRLLKPHLYQNTSWLSRWFGIPLVVPPIVIGKPQATLLATFRHMLKQSKPLIVKLHVRYKTTCSINKPFFYYKISMMVYNFLFR